MQIHALKLILTLPNWASFRGLHSFWDTLYIRDIDLSKFGTQANSVTDDTSIDIERDGIFSDEQFEVDEPLHNDTVFELAEQGAFIGLRSQPNSIEQFSVAEVIAKDTATENSHDKYGHCILAGEYYLEIKYLQQVNGNLVIKLNIINRRNNVPLYMLQKSL